MAHKKAAWSTKNLKDSQPKYRWVKVFWWQKVIPWNIIIRQKGNKFECGKNVYMWRDFTILSKIAWVVTFKKKKFKRFDGRVYLKTVVEVFPFTEVKIEKVIKSKKVIEEIISKKPVSKTVKVAEKIEKTPIEKKETVKKTPVKKAATEKKETVKKVPIKKVATEKKEIVKKAPAKKIVKK